MCARLIRGVGDFELTRLKMGTNKNYEKSEGKGGGGGGGGGGEGGGKLVG